jgi:uncharacterized protein
LIGTRLGTSLMLIALVAAPALAGCRESPRKEAAPAGVETVRVQIGNETFALEIADSLEEHKRGLMFRDTMPADHGMIFLFSGERERKFWMKDTLIPLDILYLDAGARVVSIKSMKARDLTPVPSDGPAKYAIELNDGAAARSGVRRGDTLTLPPEILSRPGAD